MSASTKSLSFFKSRQALLGLIVSFAIVIFVYIWYCSYEFWTEWPTHTLFYDPLATAFTHGSLALEKEVDPALLALDNPYDPKQRRKLDFPMDFSLYKGKYYLYFGPVPALPLAILKLLGAGTIGDQYLVFAGVTGLFIFQSLLIIFIRRRFFPTIPFWILPLCIIFAGLIAPLPRLLTDGRVYETAIAWGQACFFAGLYFIITSLGEEHKPAWRLILAGLFWALAIGSRMTQVFSVGFMVLMLAFFALKTYLRTRTFSKAIYPLVMVGLPLALGLAVLGWYNWARFGNVLETGITYQLTTPDLQGYRDVLVSPLYVLPNLYNYIAAPPKVSEVFPFLQSIRGRGNLLFPFIELPKVYYTRSMTGILYSTPFVIFAGLSVLSAPFLKKRQQEDPGNPDGDSHLLKWLLFSLLGSFLIVFAFTVSFFWVETRYFADFTPSLILLSIIGFWLGYRFFARWPTVHKMYIIAGVSLLFISVLSSNLLLFSNQASVYQFLFPERWNVLTGISSKIVEFFR